MISPGVAEQAPSSPPGLAPERLQRLVHQAVADCRLDLRGRTVLTEAATGAYFVTPVLAALAGAEVLAVTRESRYGTVRAVTELTMALARRCGVDERVRVLDGVSPDVVGRADVITNSGHLRPLDARIVAWMKPGAVVPLMFEAWELQAGRVDVDLEALRARGIATAGTNERHPDVDVFSYLGMMAVKALHEAGIPVYRSHIGLLCDNPFRTHLERGLSSCGATVHAAGSWQALDRHAPLDAVLVAMTPTGRFVVDAAAAHELADAWPGATVVQYWGDVDRESLSGEGIEVWPALEPFAGHMAVLPSDIGPDPIVRLQAGGLKVGQVLLTPPAERTAADIAFLDER